MIRRLIPFVLLAAVLSACAAQPSPYQPTDGRYGYAETQVDARTWRVEFAGNSVTSREKVENFLLLRAAEVMEAAGHRRFIILEKEVQHTRNQDVVQPFGHYGVYGRRTYAGMGMYQTFTYDYFTAIATVRAFEEEAAPADLLVYETGDVIARLKPLTTPTP